MQDKHFLLPSSLNSSPNKLIKAASFSELSINRKTTAQQQSIDKCGNLLKQYSCEQIYDYKSSTKQLIVSHVVKSDNEEFKCTWTNSFPMKSSIKMCDTSSEDETELSQNSFSYPNQNIEASSSRSFSLAPAKLVFGGSKSELSAGYNSKSHGNHTTSVNSESNESKVYPKKSRLPVRKSMINNNIVKNEISTEKRTSRIKKNFDCNTPLPSVTLNNDIVQNDTSMDISIEKNEAAYIYKNRPLVSVNKSIINNDIVNDKAFTEKSEKNTDAAYDVSALHERLKSLNNRQLVTVEPKQRKSLINSCWPYKFIVLFSILIPCLAYFLNTENLSKKFCNPRFEFHRISEDLKSRIYNQENVIDELTEYFRDKNNKTGFNVLALIGGIGVGKSYTAEIIKSGMKATNNVVDVFPPLINKEDESYASLSICRCNLIRLENLKTDDISDAAVFAEKLKKKARDYCILVIALFNTQEVDEHLKKTLDLNKSVSLIKQAFDERKLQPTLISYRPMDRKALTKCMEDAADYSNVKLTTTDVENILHELLLADNGCKGVYAKVQLRFSSKL